MRRLLRAVALSSVLTLAALSASSALPFGPCRILCTGTPFTFVTVTSSQEACCGGTLNPCPAGSTPIPISWNGKFCGPV